jgi:hypothetical protein
VSEKVDKISIQFEGPGQGRVWIGDIEISHLITKIEVESEAQDFTFVSLTLSPARLDVKAIGMEVAEPLTLLLAKVKEVSIGRYSTMEANDHAV